MRESFVFYISYYEAISELDEKTQIQLFKAICKYALYGELPELSGVEKAIFALIKPTVDANEQRYINGKKGGRPKKNNGFDDKKPPVINSETTGYENKKPNVNVNVTDNVNVNDNENSLSGKPDSVPSSPEPQKKKGLSENTETFEKIVSYLNEKTGKKFQAGACKTKSLINARLKEKFTVEDFFKVIDVKCSEWLNDPKMCQYLRPETLFGSKFESYLNQNINIPERNDNYESIYRSLDPDDAPF